MSNALGMVFTGFLIGQTSTYRDVYLAKADENKTLEPFALRVLTDHFTGSFYKNEAKYIRDVIDGTSIFKVNQ
jgi:hypothetical protein